ncbi:diaminopimelate epimerase [Brachybacterium sp. EF45031]|uniref:diaminopimelate epimerase n=1 Tax=Brachybacterium sillae TaxID=2810536 RepID=UPI00217EBC65|nr:diaminopimelate epimerase [Brachybacterium sillae]MCS6712379.1 diaminopimelate epimerase [Brachybacterium sillae]
MSIPVEHSTPTARTDQRGTTPLPTDRTGRTSPLRRFTKGHGTENDFVLVEDVDGQLDLDEQTVRTLADRRAGIGGDGVIRVVRTRAAGIDAPADAPEWFMDYRNADGSLAQMCGNGVRVFAAYLDRAGLAPEGAFPIWTRAGVRTIEILQRPRSGHAEWIVRVGMGPARFGDTPREVALDGDGVPAIAVETVDVDMGNPHAVAFLPEPVPLERLDLSRRLDLTPAPEGGTNIEVVSERGPRHVAMRVVERGVGETRSCGTGVAAVAAAAARRAGDTSGADWRVDVPGGTLTVGWTPQGELTLTGPAALVADGELI